MTPAITAIVKVSNLNDQGVKCGPCQFVAHYRTLPQLIFSWSADTGELFEYQPRKSWLRQFSESLVLPVSREVQHDVNHGVTTGRLTKVGIAAKSHAKYTTR